LLRRQFTNPYAERRNSRLTVTLICSSSLAKKTKKERWKKDWKYESKHGSNHEGWSREGWIHILHLISTNRHLIFSIIFNYLCKHLESAKPLHSLSKNIFNFWKEEGNLQSRIHIKIIAYRLSIYEKSKNFVNIIWI